MNSKSLKVVNRLKEMFSYPTNNVGEDLFLENPLGIEIEIKWRDYFPQLHKKFLEDTSYKNLSIEKQKELTKECDELEKILLPKLERTIDCGIPRGADRYWEFAFEPATNISLISQQVEILKYNDLIPLGNHSLHITVGNMKINKDAYYLLMLLELMTCSPERISHGFNKENNKLSAGWARKGLGGLFEKEERELKYNSVVAVEMRTLELRQEIELYKILKITGLLADIIIAKQNNKENNAIGNWNNFVEKSQEILINLKLADKNWKKPNINPEYWNHYIQHFEELKESIINCGNEYLSDIIGNIKPNKSSNKKNVF